MTGLDADVLVVGVGTMGSMALWRLALRGADVLGFEQFEVGHDRGSGHGESRMIRSAYHEGPDYVPLVRSAFGLWRELERESGAQLLTMTGALMIGRRNSDLVTGALASASSFRLPHQVLDRTAAAALFPQHRLQPDEVALHEAEAGVLRPEAAIRAAAARAEALGARLVRNTRVTAVRLGTRVELEAGGATYRGRHLVVCAGPWLAKLQPQLGSHLEVERQVMGWFRAPDPAEFLPGRFPAFIHETGETMLYGLPSMDGDTVKVAIHHGGATADPDSLDREARQGDLEPISALVSRTLPGLEPRPVRGLVCMYTNTPDRHFLVGQHPASELVTVLGGFSGHGFKFAPVLGDVAADLALAGRTAHPISAFDPARFPVG